MYEKQPCRPPGESRRKEGDAQGTQTGIPLPAAHERSMLEQFIPKDCSPQERPTLEQFGKDLLSVGSSHAGAGKTVRSKDQQKQSVMV